MGLVQQTKSVANDEVVQNYCSDISSKNSSTGNTSIIGFEHGALCSERKKRVQRCVPDRCKVDTRYFSELKKSSNVNFNFCITACIPPWKTVDQSHGLTLFFCDFYTYLMAVLHAPKAVVVRLLMQSECAKSDQTFPV